MTTEQKKPNVDEIKLHNFNANLLDLIKSYDLHLHVDEISLRTNTMHLKFDIQSLTCPPGCLRMKVYIRHGRKYVKRWCECD